MESAPTTVEDAIAMAYPTDARCTRRVLAGVGNLRGVLDAMALTVEEVMDASFAWATVVHAPDEFYSTRLGLLLRDIQAAFKSTRGVNPKQADIWYGYPQRGAPGLWQQAQSAAGATDALSIRHLSPERVASMAGSGQGFQSIALAEILDAAFLEIDSVESSRRHEARFFPILPPPRDARDFWFPVLPVTILAGGFGLRVGRRTVHRREPKLARAERGVPAAHEGWR